MNSNFIISYDITNAKRLQKLSRQVEKIGMRIQYSVYLLYSFSQRELSECLEMINEIINIDEDDVRIYRILSSGISLGRAVDLDNPLIF